MPGDDAPDNLIVRAYYTPDFELPICRTEATLLCAPGSPQLLFEPDGWLGGGVEISPELGTSDPGDLVTITIGVDTDEIQDNGVILTNEDDSPLNATTLVVPDCEVDFAVYCVRGQAVAEISQFDNDAHPTGFTGFELNGDPTLVEPGVYPINSALPSATASDPTGAVIVTATGSLA